MKNYSPIQILGAMVQSGQITPELYDEIVVKRNYEFDNQSELFVQALVAVNDGNYVPLNNKSTTYAEGLVPFISGKMPEGKIVVGTGITLKWQTAASLTAATAVPVNTKASVVASLINAQAVVKVGGNQKIKVPVTKLLTDASADTYDKIVLPFKNPVLFTWDKDVEFGIHFHTGAAAFANPTVVRVDIEGIALSRK